MAQSDAPTVSVLIATFNRPELLRKCLRSLAGCSPAADEIVIADQSDDDRSRLVVDEWADSDLPVRHLRVERKGKSRALNEAVQTSSGDVLALTDDDVEVEPGWIGAIRDLARREPEVVAFCGRILPEPGSDPGTYYNLVLSTRERWITPRSNPLTPGFCGANIAVRRDAMLRVGAYNVHFGPGALFKNNDDGELAYRLTRDGGRVHYVPELFVYHSAWRGEVDTDALKFDYTYSLGAFAGYYLRRGHGRPVLYLVKKWLFKARQLLVGLLSGDRSRMRDSRIQLRGLGLGLLRGLGIAESGTLEPSAAVRRNQA